jgi:hypothetical protein
MLRRIRYSQWKKALSGTPQHNQQRNIIDLMCNYT